MTEKIEKLMYGGEVKLVFYPNSHQYKIDGKNQISVTAITGIVDKSKALIHRATNLAKEYLLGILNPPPITGPCGPRVITESNVVTACDLHSAKKEESTSIGLAVHKRVEDYIVSGNMTLPEDSSIINGVNAFLDRIKTHKVEFLESERLIYSKKYEYVGITDCIAIVDGKKMVIDFKTSKAFYPLEMGMQVSAYLKAYEEEMKDIVDGAMVVRFDKETGLFHPHLIEEVEEDFKAFLGALELKKRQKYYESKKTINEVSNPNS